MQRLSEEPGSRGAAGLDGDAGMQAGQSGASFTIGDLAREFEVTLRTLRFYEDKGLVSPRRDGLNRIYSAHDRARLRLVLIGKRVGFSLSDIRGMLDLYDLRDGRAPQLTAALSRFEEQIVLLERQKRDLEQALGELRRSAGASAALATKVRPAV